MLIISAQSIPEKLSEVLCTATGATLDPLPFISTDPAINIAFPANENLTPSITIISGDALSDKNATQLTLSITLKSLDIFPLLQCILVFLRERKTITPQLEENILSALHEALLNALIHGNLGQHSDYNDSYKMFDHFEAIGKMLLTSDKQETLEMAIEFLPEQIAISITDNGKGFSADAIVPPGESALHGRGMAIIRECADMVDITDHGRTITLRFACGALYTQAQERLANAHILIVEDVAVNRAIITQMLKQHGFKHFSIAIDGMEAYEKTLALKPDLVLLDLVLPRMDGYEYCRKIRQLPQMQNLPIVVQTVLSQSEQRSKAFACGASDLITKPINGYEMAARISLLLEKQILLKVLFL
jgi:CheY-like chemotaxis protein